MNWDHSLEYLFITSYVWSRLYLGFESIFRFFSALSWTLETTSGTRCWIPGVKRIEPKPSKGFKIDKIKFQENSHLILDVFPPVYLSKLNASPPVIQVL